MFYIDDYLELNELFVLNSIDQEKIEKLKKIDNFIQINSKIVEEELDNIKAENQVPRKQVDTQVIKSIGIASTKIEEYIDSELRNNKVISFNKIIELEKEKYFDIYKKEYSELVRKVFSKYPVLHNQTNRFFTQGSRKHPGFGEFAETALYFAFVRKIKKKYFNIEFILGLCNNLTVNQLILRKEVYRKAFNDIEEQSENNNTIIHCNPEMLVTLLSIFKISKCKDVYGAFWDNYWWVFSLIGGLILLVLIWSIWSWCLKEQEKN
jgi:hypothetical protein